MPGLGLTGPCSIHFLQLGSQRPCEELDEPARDRLHGDRSPETTKGGEGPSLPRLLSHPLPRSIRHTRRLVGPPSQCGTQQRRAAPAQHRVNCRTRSTSLRLEAGLLLSSKN